MTKKGLTRYEISLRDETSWAFDGDGDTISLMTELSRIMTMPTGTRTSAACSIVARSGFSLDPEAGSDDPSKGLKKAPQQKPQRSTWCYLGPVVEVRLEATDGLEKYISMSHLLLPVYWSSIRKGGFPAHAALAEVDGKGVLIAAPGGTGKSTCMRRLPVEWKPLCDDEALVVCDGRGQYHVHPFPTWTDYIWKRAENTWDVQYSVPLEALFFLEQAEIDEVIAIGPGETAMLAYQASIQVCNKYIPRMGQSAKNELVRNVFENACVIARKIPGYRLKATLDGRFWEGIEQAIRPRTTQAGG